MMELWESPRGISAGFKLNVSAEYGGMGVGKVSA